MRAFGIAVVLAILLAIGAGFGLDVLQQTSAYAYRDGDTTRFNQQEAVDNYGRQG